MPFHAPCPRVPLLVVGAALLAAVAAAAPQSGRTGAPPTSEAPLAVDTRAPRQLAGGGPVASTEA